MSDLRGQVSTATGSALTMARLARDNGEEGLEASWSLVAAVNRLTLALLPQPGVEPPAGQPNTDYDTWGA